MKTSNLALVLFTALAFASCKKEKEEEVIKQTVTDTPLNPSTAPRQAIDRFSALAGTLMVRDGANGLPTSNSAINFDAAPFITKGLGPNGQLVEYYNFDVMSTSSAPIYVLFKPGESSPVSGQLNIVDVIPGSSGYNDFWHVVKVNVPSDYVANTVTSVAEINSKGYSTEQTSTIVNCPIVPEGSTATKRIGSGTNGLIMGWYNDKIIYYFTFEEAILQGTSDDEVPYSPIYVTFNVNPNEPNGGPPSGFVVEPGTDQTHNVLFSLPGDSDYSPLWSVSVYDNADFNNVTGVTTATAANIIGANVMTVNCPVAAVN
jgi:hypothetical protein